jgi:hypothetical protein
VLAIPFYGLGWAALARPLADTDPGAARVVRGAGGYGAAIGAAIHGITGAVLAAERRAAGAAIDAFGMMGKWAALLLPLWGIATVLVVWASWRWARAARRGAAGVAPWTAWANPALGTLVVAALGAGTPLGRAFLVPAAPNLAHVVFFGVTAAARRAR